MFEKKGKQKKRGKNFQDLLCEIKLKCSKINLSTWYFSVSFFVAIFIVSMWIWWISLHNPRPSGEVISKFESSRENFQAMKASTEKAIGILEQRRGRILSTPDFSSWRDYFVEQGMSSSEDSGVDENQELQGDNGQEGQDDTEVDFVQ